MSKKYDKKILVNLSLESTRVLFDGYDARVTDHSWYSVGVQNKTTYLSPSAQRMGGYKLGSGWTHRHGRGYVADGLRGQTFNVIIKANVKSCLRNAQDRGDKRSEKYYQKLWDGGYTHDSIDGWNSESYITAYLDSEDEMFIIDSREPSTKVYFKDLPEAVRQEIQVNRQVKLVELNNIMIDEKCQLFRDVNESEKLRNQEWRQARESHVAHFIRDAANYQNGALDIRKMFLYLVYNNEADLDKRSHEEMVAKLAYKILKNYQVELQKTSLDAFYETVDILDSSAGKRVQFVLNETARMANTLPCSMKQKLKKGGLQNLWDMVDIIERRNLRIVKYNEFLEWFLNVHHDALEAAGNVATKNEEELSYTYWTNNHDKQDDYNRIRQMLSDRLAVTQDKLLVEGVLKHKRPTNARFNFGDKIKLWNLQGKKDRNDIEISALDLYLGKTHADHMKSVAAGGSTTLANGELMFAEDNLRKGATSNAPHFPHQQEEFAFSADRKEE